MANVKLKSIFTKEDIYTVLQLLKALADGVDENDTNMQAQIDELKTKIDTLKPEPEGYSVDNAGNVTIAGALKANNNGDVEVSKNLNVNGGMSAISRGFVVRDSLKPLSAEGQTFTATGSFIELNVPNIQYPGSTPSGADQPKAIGLYVSESGISFYPCMSMNMETGEPSYTNAGDPETSAFSVSVATSFVTWSEEDGTKYLPLDTRFGNLYEHNNTTINDLVNRVNLSSTARYQHTITIKFDNTNKNILTFTAMCDNSLSIASLQDLSIYFGGCRLTCSGGDDTGDRYVYLDTHPSNPNDYVVGYVNSTGFHTDETIGTLTGTGMTITDDVCIPK